jgi:hypothetical protein
MILKEPDSVDVVDVAGVVGVLLHPTRREATSTAAVRGMNHICFDICKLFSSFIFLFRWFRSASIPSINRIQGGL